MKIYRYKINVLTEEDNLSQVGQLMKICTKCNKGLPFSVFGSEKHGRWGIMSVCRECDNKAYVVFMQNPEARARRKANWQKPSRKEHAREYKQSPLGKAALRRYQQSEKCKKRWEAYKKTSKYKESYMSRYNTFGKTELGKAKVKEYQKSEKGKAAIIRNYKRHKSFVCNRLNDAIHAGIYASLKGNKNRKKWQSLVGYSLKELIEHLEKQFTNGMAWDNYGCGMGKWHIDHIIPKAVFGYNSSSDLDFRRCWTLSNLRPMWGKDNLEKKDKIIKPFQPSLDVILNKGEIKAKVAIAK